MNDKDELVPRMTTCAEFHITPVTLGRWLKGLTPGTEDFPRPVRIGGRVYFLRRELDAFRASKINAARESTSGVLG